MTHRWTAPDLTDAEARALAQIEEIDWTRPDEQASMRGPARPAAAKSKRKAKGGECPLFDGGEKGGEHG